MSTIKWISILHNKLHNKLHIYMYEIRVYEIRNWNDKQTANDKRQTHYLRIIIKIEIDKRSFVFNVVSKQASKQDIECIVLNFTIRTGGTYFYFICMHRIGCKRYFVRLPINFVRGWCFFTPVTAPNATYSIEVEYFALKQNTACLLFRWWGMLSVCVVCVM